LSFSEQKEALVATIEVGKIAKDISREALAALEKTDTPALPPYYAMAFSDAARKRGSNEQSERYLRLDDESMREHRLEESFLFARKALNEYANSVGRLKNRENALDLSKLEADEISAVFADEIKSYVDAVARETRKAEASIGALEGELGVIEAQSFVDPLTRLRTPAILKYQLERILQIGLNRDLDLWIALFAIDDYAQIKEEYGYMVAEKILLFTAKSLLGTLRSDNRVYRYNEDWQNESVFCAVFNRADKQGALLATERVRSRIEASKLVYNEKIISVTVSAALSPHRAGDDEKTIRDRAEKTLSKALSQGKNAIIVYEN
jgi:diguanylate cyclase (GGDEF)-like protein